MSLFPVFVFTAEIFICLLSKNLCIMDKNAYQSRHIAANLEHGADGSTALHTSVQHEPLRHDEGKKVYKDVIANPAQVQDVGWGDGQIRPEDYAIDGIKNEDIWLLVRRFNKVSL